VIRSYYYYYYYYYLTSSIIYGTNATINQHDLNHQTYLRANEPKLALKTITNNNNNIPFWLYFVIGMHLTINHGSRSRCVKKFAINVTHQQIINPFNNQPLRDCQNKRNYINLPWNLSRQATTQTRK
jgi:hypothetical protein